jgi:hypothetical protein
MDRSFLARRLKFMRHTASFLVSLVLCLFCSTAALAEQGWLIEQDDKVNGPRTIYLSRQGIRIELKSGKSFVVSRPPTWNVVSYSDQTKKYFECPVDKFVNGLSKPIAAIWGVNLAVLPLKPVASVTKYGIVATSYESEIIYDEKFWKRDLKDRNARRLPLSVSAIYTDALKIPPAEASVLTRLSNIPAPGGVPLVFTYKDQDGDAHLEVRTFAIKSVDVSKVIFDKPAGYTRVSKQGDVLRAVENDEDLKNLF